MITDKYSVIIPIDDAPPIGFINMFDKGDEWVKVKGCIDYQESK